MSEYKQRVVEECAELENKIDKLISFMHGDLYASLVAVEKGMLMVQLSHMKSYAGVLHDRIERFHINKV